MFCEKVFLKISQNSLENTSARAFFFNKKTTLLKKEALEQVLSVIIFVEISKNTFFIEHLWRLFLQSVLSDFKP